MSIVNRIDDAIIKMRHRNIEPESINLVSEDYNNFHIEYRKKLGLSYLNAGYKISHYLGLIVCESQGMNGKSFLSITVKLIHAKNKSEIKNMKEMNLHFKSNPEHYYEII